MVTRAHIIPNIVSIEITWVWKLKNTSNSRFMKLYCMFLEQVILIYYLSNPYWYVKMPDVTASYGMPPNFIMFLTILHKIDEYSCLLYLHQTFINCVFDVNINFSL